MGTPALLHLCEWAGAYAYRHSLKPTRLLPRQVDAGIRGGSEGKDGDESESEGEGRRDEGGWAVCHRLDRTPKHGLSPPSTKVRAWKRYMRTSSPSMRARSSQSTSDLHLRAQSPPPSPGARDARDAHVRRGGGRSYFTDVNASHCSRSRMRRSRATCASSTASDRAGGGRERSMHPVAKRWPPCGSKECGESPTPSAWSIPSRASSAHPHARMRQGVISPQVERARPRMYD
jgi:hypothetical protein